MSLQSSETKLIGAIIIKGVNIKKITFNANRVMGHPDSISRTTKEISILPLRYCYRP